MTAILHPQSLGAGNQRPASPDPDIANLRLDELRQQTRHLWNNDPRLSPSDREAVIVELTDVDLRLERLAMRSRWTELDHGDMEDLVDCSHRLIGLQSHWVAD